MGWEGKNLKRTEEGNGRRRKGKEVLKWESDQKRDTGKVGKVRNRNDNQTR